LFDQAHLKARFSPAGVHLFDRATGMNVLLDEIRVPSVMWTNAPRQVSIALTNACDLSCSYCFAPKNHAVLDFEMIISWLDELDANGCFGIGFGGGEPTLYPRLAELCQYAAENTRLAVTFTTHAHHLDESLVSALASNVHFVRISMDGVGATYEALRGRSFAVLRQKLTVMQQLSPFGINFVVNSRTFLDLDAATALAAEVGASEFLLLPEQPVRGAGGIDSCTAQELHLWVAQYRGKVRLTVSEAGADGLPTCNPLDKETGLCAYVHIDASGILKHSSYENDGVAIGDGGVMQAINELQTFRRRNNNENLARL